VLPANADYGRGVAAGGATGGTGVGWPGACVGGALVGATVGGTTVGTMVGATVGATALVGDGGGGVGVLEVAADVGVAGDGVLVGGGGGGGGGALLSGGCCVAVAVWVMVGVALGAAGRTGAGLNAVGVGGSVAVAPGTRVGEAVRVWVKVGMGMGTGGVPASLPRDRMVTIPAIQPAEAMTSSSPTAPYNARSRPVRSDHHSIRRSTIDPL